MPAMPKYNILLFFICICLINIQCKKDERDINLNLTEVTDLFTPADAKYIKLDPKSGASESFEWGQAKAEDGSLVLYEVAFDQENGDFSHPFYTVVSDNKGVMNKLTLTHADLNRIASLGGADFYQRKKFKWTVMATKGMNVKQATMARIIDLERPNGFAVIPATLYISGSATESGDVLSNALPMKKLKDGVFEIFTKLKAGTYTLYDGNSGSPKQYFITEDNGNKTIGVNGQTTFAGPDKIMRIQVDFINIAAAQAEVKSVQLWYCAGNTFWMTLPYAGNGIWKYNNYTVNYTQMPWGFEQRYKYKMVLNDGSGDKNLWLNYATNDSPDQEGQYPHKVEYKTINMERNDSSQWDWSWKFDRNYLTQGSVADFWVSLRATDAAYTVNYQKQ
jgi:starch-binding outer membrane protein SusE/F